MNLACDCVVLQSALASWKVLKTYSPGVSPQEIRFGYPWPLSIAKLSDSTCKTQLITSLFCKAFAVNYDNNYSSI